MAHIVVTLAADGDAIQAALLEWTGQRTVPNVFIGGKHIGGCDGINLILFNFSPRLILSPISIS